MVEFFNHLNKGCFMKKPHFLFFHGSECMQILNEKYVCLSIFTAPINQINERKKKKVCLAELTFHNSVAGH